MSNLPVLPCYILKKLPSFLFPFNHASTLSLLSCLFAFACVWMPLPACGVGDTTVRIAKIEMGCERGETQTKSTASIFFFLFLVRIILVFFYTLYIDIELCIPTCLALSNSTPKPIHFLVLALTGAVYELEHVGPGGNHPPPPPKYVLACQY